MELIFASGNAHKIKELNDKSPGHIQVISMREKGFEGEIAEPGETLEENARIKADFIYDLFGENVFADDSGLEIEALDGAPGVFSARYAGPDCSFEDNNKKVLIELAGEENRRAHFRTVIHLILNGEHFSFEGAVNGTIIAQLKGTEGFGYDPIFLPEGHDRTFAEMSLAEKNSISHRAQAVEKLIHFLHSR
ncbi:MAG: RdgB/HAM1 family non-canonical purine NTP pyrophosphatase [Flavobacteriales bacterium]|nr:RdgB/HAM1 family non-canonical purine NTP pyrophosphatase [Flavobacteriales bacterium]